MLLCYVPSYDNGREIPRKHGRRGFASRIISSRGSLVGVIKSKPGEGIIGGYIRGVNGMEEEKMAEFSS